MECCGEDVRGDWDVLGRRMGSPWSMQPHGPKAGGMACGTELGAKKNPCTGVVQGWVLVGCLVGLEPTTFRTTI